MRRAITLLTIDSHGGDFYPIDTRVQRWQWTEYSIEELAHSMANNARRVSLLRAFARSSKFDVIVSFGDKTNVLLLLATRGLKIPVIVAEHSDRASGQSEPRRVSATVAVSACQRCSRFNIGSGTMARQSLEAEQFA